MLPSGFSIWSPRIRGNLDEIGEALAPLSSDAPPNTYLAINIAFTGVQQDEN